MNRLVRVAVPFLFLALNLADSRAQVGQVHRVDVVDYGVYTASVTRAERRPTGILRSTVTNIEHVETSRIVPARLGVRFGFRYNVVGDPSGAEVSLKRVTIFPPGGLRPPGSARELTRSETTITVKLGEQVRYIGYSFDDPWELQPGQWTMELWYGDHKLASQDFTVVKP